MSLNSIGEFERRQLFEARSFTLARSVFHPDYRTSIIGGEGSFGAHRPTFMKLANCRGLTQLYDGVVLLSERVQAGGLYLYHCNTGPLPPPPTFPSMQQRQRGPNGAAPRLNTRLS